MELFIQIRDGQPHEHPILGDNFRQAFPDINVDNLPPQFARFERIECPRAAGVYEVDVVSYQWVDGIVKDVWTVRPMTDEERAIKYAQLVSDIQNSVASSKKLTQQLISLDWITEPQKEKLREYLVELDNFTFSDPVTAVVPPIPKVSKDGIILRTDVPGAAPDVTG